MSSSAVTETSQPGPGDTIRAKWLMDGATTLAEAADQLVAEATRLRPPRCRVGPQRAD
jgi:hypothetical protein